MPKIEGNARNRILDAAFALFSEKGFTATSMRDIADAVGIKAASLYNHFAGKRELFDALVERETDYVLEQVRLVGAMATPDDDSTAYAKLEGNALADLVWDSYKPFFENDRVKMLMRMLAANRYADKNCKALYETISIERPIAIQGTIFERLVSEGRFGPCDTQLTAVQFHSPMLMLMERQSEAREAREFCRAHTEAFNALHGKES